jgi:signal transduction histidine kinase
LSKILARALLLPLVIAACAPPPSERAVDVRSGAVLALDRDTPPPDTPDWKPVSLPDLWTESRPTYEGSVWYRFEVPRPRGDGHRWAIYLPRVHMNAAAFVNGRWVGDGGSFVPPVAQNWNRPLYFSVAPEMLDRDDNVVHVRIYSYAYDRGGLWPFSIGPHEELFGRYRTQALWQVEAAKASSLLALVMIAIVGAIWLGRRSETVYLYFVLAGFVYFVNSLSGHVTDIVVPYTLGRWAVHVAVDWYAVLMIVGVHRWTDTVRPRVERALWTYAIAGSIVVLITPSPWFSGVSTAVHAVGLAIAYYGLSVAFRRWQMLRGAEALIVLTGGGIVAGVCSHGLMIQLGLLPQDAPRLLKLIAPVVMFGFGAVLVARFVRNANETEKLNRELEGRVAAKEQELRANFERLSSMEADRVVVAERERIMREMHDGIGAHLVSVLALVDAGADAASLSQALQDALHEMRVVIDSLDPDTDEIPTALGMLRRRLEPHLAKQGVRFKWRVEDIPTPPHVDHRGLLHVMRIAQEAITNTLKHAGASTIEVRATANDDTIEVTIEDDGSGFDPETANGGRGLVHIRHRAAELGGNAIITGDGGTAVVVRIPLNR